MRVRLDNKFKKREYEKLSVFHTLCNFIKAGV